MLRLAIVPLLFALLLPWAAAADEIRLTTGGDYAPYVDQRLPGGGVAVQIVRAVYGQLGRQTELQILPWKRGYAATKAGQFAATFPYVRTSEREADFVYSAPLASLEHHLFSTARLKLEKIQAVAGLRLCLPLGYAPSPSLRELLNGGRLRVVEAPDLAACARMLTADRADFFVIDRRTGRRSLKAAALPDEAIHVSRRPVAQDSLHLIVPRVHPHAAEEIAAFNAALARLKASGELAKLTAGLSDD